MKKTASPRKRVLQLSLETVRTLSGADLARINAGCDTSTNATEQTQGATYMNCATKV